LLSNMTRAHHSFAASYDPARLVTVKGVVTELLFPALADQLAIEAQRRERVLSTDQ